MAKVYSTFGSYILFREVVSDCLGHLYRASEHDEGGLKAAEWLRVLDSPFVPKQDLLASFAQANQVAQVLQATNVVSKSRHFELDGTPAFVCSYVAGQPLSVVFEKVTQEGFPVPVDNALLILEKLALALSAALTVEIGGSSMVHGFLHPALVLVSNDGEGLVGGFGFADQLLGLLDQPEAAACCQPYLAPEVLLTRTASKRGDVYSMGSILFQLLTGKMLPCKPEERGGVLEGAELAYDEQPIPADIQTLLGRALAVRPEERFSSAADFKKELDKLLYGGAYSPTTFNLALFMDRLFRTEIESEEKERIEESQVDVSEYLMPEPIPEPVLPETLPSERARTPKGLWIGLVAVGLVAAVAVSALVLKRGPAGPEQAPTPSPEQIAADRAAQEERLRQLAAQYVEEMMAEKEEEIRQELLARQTKIEELQKRLRETEAKASLTNEEKRHRQELQREIAREEEAKRKLQEEQEAERKRVLQEAQAAAAAQAATATAVAILQAQPTLGPTPPAPEPTRVVEVTPTKIADLIPTRVARVDPTPAVVIAENMFMEPTQVDTLPAILKEEPVTWPRLALHSRRRGMVIVQATVDASGAVVDAKVLRADDDGFGIPEAVVEAVRKYYFKPATKNGIKVKSYATVTKRYNFRSR